MSLSMFLNEFCADKGAVSSTAIVVLLILATLLISVVIAMFILGMGG